MTQDEIIELACQTFGGIIKNEERKNFLAFAKMVAEKAIKEALAQPKEPDSVAWEQFYPDIGKPKFVAQPEQEPVAWVYPEGLEALKAGKPWTAYGTRQEPNNTALYLSPQPDIPPYAWVTFTPYGDEDDVWYENPEGQLLEGWTYKPLYDTTPPKREWVGLTDDDEIPWDGVDAKSFAQAIEAKLKQKNTRGQE